MSKHTPGPWTLYYDGESEKDYGPRLITVRNPEFDEGAIATIRELEQTPARPCTAHDITWGPSGGQCINCGGEGPSCYEVKHAPQPKNSSG
jgi:hypothetical protein